MSTKYLNFGINYPEWFNMSLIKNNCTNLVSAESVNIMIHAFCAILTKMYNVYNIKRVTIPNMKTILHIHHQLSGI